MAVLQEYKCPCCDGAIEFNAQLQKMKCPYCDTEFDLDTLEAYEAELHSQLQDDMTWDTAAGGEWTEGEADSLQVYTCNTCGGEIVTDSTTAATECPFCGNPVIMTGQFAGALKPDLVIPFQVDKKGAIAALQRLYKGKVLLPKVFKDQNHIKDIKGVYVPVWLFDADANAHIRYKATRTRMWSDSQYRYTETSHFAVTRAGAISFENVPVDGSTKMDDTLMESLEPFHLRDAVDFQTAYLSGYLADKYDVDADTSIERANQRIKQSTEEAFAATVQGYSSVIPVDSSIHLQNGRAKYALFPVWILNTQWKGQNFTFGINGQTGKITGNLPMDKGKFWTLLLGIAGAVTVVAYAFSYLGWLLGGA